MELAGHLGGIYKPCTACLTVEADGPYTALSTHTGGFQGNTFLDLTDQMGPLTSHWKRLDLAFDPTLWAEKNSRDFPENSENHLRKILPNAMI